MTALVRTLAFVRKEAAEVVRQPQLLLLLVIGPFLVFLAFGAGLREEHPPVRTLFVSPAESDLTSTIVEVADAQGGRLTVEGMVSDEQRALDRLEQRQVDLVVSFPVNIRNTIRGGERTVITLYHAEMDPIEGHVIRLVARSTVDDVNRLVVSDAVAAAQEETEALAQWVAESRERASRLSTAAAGLPSEALAAGAVDGDDLAELRGDVAALALAARPVLGFIDGLWPEEGARTIRERLDRVRQVHERFEGTADEDLVVGELADAEEALSDLEAALTDFRSLSPRVAVAPFRARTVRVGADDVTLGDFYAPAVAVVLLQHLLVTALGLSLVRETELGTTELYRVAPLRPGEIVVGKFLAHMVVAALVGALLVTALVVGLGIPMAGDPAWLVTTLVAVLFASAALGFVVALAARSDSQAVQYAMLVLLVTVFFSGFMLSLDRFIAPVAWGARLVPATYGIEAVREVMLRGVPPKPELLTALGAYGAVLGVLSWVWLRTRLRVG